jgi:hypothetical protein
MDRTRRQSTKSRRQPYHRLRPSLDRRLDRIWSVLRELRRDIGSREAAELSGASLSYTKHVLIRLAREGVLAQSIEDQAPGTPAYYDLLQDLGPRAPILHGGPQTRPLGITNPNLRGA